MKSKETAIEIKIGKLWNSGEGTTEKFHLDQPVQFDTDQIKPLSNLECDVMLIKMKDEITVILSNVKITIQHHCERCLKELKHEVHVDSAERQFRVQPDSHDSDPFETFLIDKHKMSIDLADMLRQEIILHFPLISLCSKSCKGLCDKCGANLNKKRCKCGPDEDLNTQKPFKDLKSLIKNNNGKTSGTKI